MRFVHLLILYMHSHVFVLKSVESLVFDPWFERRLDSFIQTTLDCRRIPGLTLAVLKDNEVFAKGYGFADLSTGRPVTEDTVFNVASVTKSFTMVLLGILLSERNMTWTTRVQDILNMDYQFTDRQRTIQMTLKDLLSHRTGLARLDIGAIAGFPRRLSRQTLVKQLRFLPELRPFRDSFTYNNYMFMYLGHICEILGWDTWENLIYRRIFIPLGMRSTRLLRDPIDVQRPDSARPYTFRDGRFVDGTANIYSISPVEPAASILSTGRDMVKWMQFLLNKGRLNDGTPLLNEQLLDEAFTPTTTITSGPFFLLEKFTKPTWPIGQSLLGYGYGLFISSYRGYERIWHDGLLISYITRLYIFPDRNIGVFLSVNGPGIENFANFAVRTVSYFASDGALGLVPWLNETTTCTFPEPFEPDDSESGTWIDTGYYIVDRFDYPGLYEHSFLPPMSVFLSRNSDSRLLFSMNRVSGVLHSSRTFDTFTMQTIEPFELRTFDMDQEKSNDTVPVRFMRKWGRVVSVVVEYEVNITYTKTESFF